MLISELLPAMAAAHPAWIAVKQGPRTLTYGQLYSQAARLARALVNDGVVSGDRIGLFGQPSIELVIAEHAAVAVGAIPIGIFPSLAPVEMQAIADDIGFAAVVFDAAHADIAGRLQHARPPVQIACESIDAVIERHAPLDAWHRPEPGDIALIIYTSGTTGRPKGVVHTYRSVSTWFNMNAGPGDTPGGRVLLYYMATVSGQATIWTAASAGGCVTLLDRYPATIEGLVGAIEREQVPTIGTIASVYRELVELPDIARRLVSLKSILVNGAPIRPHALQRIADVFRGAQVLETYALTESGPVISILPVALALRTKRLERLASVGLPSAMHLFQQKPFDVRIVDDAGRDVEPGEAGEVIVRGDQMMVGYWNDPIATAETLRDGWLHTGDLGRFDESGYLYLLDRKKDMMIGSNGYCVFSAEIEAVVEHHPAVAEVAVVGARQAEGHELVAAFATLRPGTTLALPELQEFCAGRIAAFKIPSSLVIVPELPRNEAGKVNKAQLRQRT